MLAKGDSIPDVELTDDEGEAVRLSQFKGKKTVIYFYPRDDTPGCTTEACEFRDAYDRILAKGAVVVGISADSETSHAGFRKKNNLPFFLLADPEKKAVQAFGVWGEKNMMGRKYMGILRTTFVANAKGNIIRVFPKVTPKDHAEEVLACL